MPHRVEAYTAGGILTGLLARPGPVRDALESEAAVRVESSRWLPLDGSAEKPSGEVEVAVDDLILVVPDDTGSIPVHAQWHDIELDAGPYRVHGEMPTMPGFDPGRALARPTGEFVVLRDARIALKDRDDAGEVSAAELLVNRYTVDRVTADLMLGFFFPGAEMTVTVVAAGVPPAQPAPAAEAAVTADPTTAPETTASETAAPPATPGDAPPAVSA
jgi:hypothetical protein